MLHAAAGALRRRGTWLVFGAIGGLIGGSIVAASAKAPVAYNRYYKATSILSLKEPAASTAVTNPVQWSLVLAQLTITSDAYRKAVASETGVTSAFVKNHLISIASEATASLSLTAITSDREAAVLIAYHAAQELSAAIKRDLRQRQADEAGGINSQLDKINRLIWSLRDQYEAASGADRASIKDNLGHAQRLAHDLRVARDTAKVNPPHFVLTSPPEAIQINSKAFYLRWSIASDDLGLPNINAMNTIGGPVSQAAANQENTSAVLQNDTDVPHPSAPPPIQPIAIGLLAGLAMGLSGVVLGEAWDDRIHDSIEAARVTGIGVIVEIPILSKRRVRELATPASESTHPKVVDAKIRYREAAWVIATKLGVEPRPGALSHVPTTSPDAPRRAPVILVTSTTPAEGKTTSTAALATALGGLGFTVLAVDGDYHHRSLRKQLRPIPSFLDDEAPAETPIDGVWHMDDPASAEHRVSSSTIVARLVKRVERERENFDIILIDTPPMLATTDAVEYLQYADAAVMIVRLDQTPAPACELTATLILRHGMAVPGVIATGVPRMVIDRYTDPDG